VDEIYTGTNCGNKFTYKLLSVLIYRFANLSIRTAASAGKKESKDFPRSVCTPFSLETGR
jgi:hypothetical protein